MYEQYRNESHVFMSKQTKGTVIEDKIFSLNTHWL